MSALVILIPTFLIDYQVQDVLTLLMFWSLTHR